MQEFKRGIVVTMGALALLTAAACAPAQQNRKDNLQASGGSLALATRMGTELQGTRERLGEDTKKAQESYTAFAGYPAALGTVGDWAAVREIYVAADEAGRTEGTVKRLESVRSTERLLNTHMDTLVNNTASAVNGALKKEGVGDVQVWGSVRYGLTQGFRKALLDEVRSVNDAHVLLMDRGEAIGKKPTATLEEQIDTITFTSYFVFVEIEDAREAMERYVEDADDAQSTLDDAIARHEAVANDEKADKGARKAAAGRVEQLKAARAPIQSEAEQARKRLETLEEEIKQLQSNYQKALYQLIEAVKAEEDKAAGAAR